MSVSGVRDQVYLWLFVLVCFEIFVTLWDKMTSCCFLPQWFNDRWKNPILLYYCGCWWFSELEILVCIAIRCLMVETKRLKFGHTQFFASLHHSHHQLLLLFYFIISVWFLRNCNCTEWQTVDRVLRTFLNKNIILTVLPIWEIRCVLTRFLKWLLLFEFYSEFGWSLFALKSLIVLLESCFDLHFGVGLFARLFFKIEIQGLSWLLPMKVFLVGWVHTEFLIWVLNEAICAPWLPTIIKRVWSR